MLASCEWRGIFPYLNLTSKAGTNDVELDSTRDIYIMDHRGMYSSSQLYDTEYGHDWNHTHRDPRLHFENVSRRPNDLTMGSYSAEDPDYRASNSRHSHGPYLHLSTAVNSGRSPSSYIQHVPPCYNHFPSGSLSSTVIPQIEHGRVSYKRKPPTFHEAFDGSSSRGYYHAGSSSSVHVSSEPFHPDARSVHQSWSPTGLGLNYGSNNIYVTGEGSQRNVRSRYSGTFHMEPNTVGHQPMNSLPRPILPTNVSGPIISGERIPSSASLDPYGRMGFSDVGSFSHETNRTFVGGGSSSSGMESYHNLSLRRNPSISLPAFEFPPRRGTEIARSIHRGQRTPYRDIPSYQPMEFTAAGDRRPSYHPVEPTSSHDRRPGVESMVPSRHLRPLSDGRMERGRSFYSGLQPISDEDSAPERWVPQGVAMAMIDRSDVFDSRSFFDHNSDMSLDVDDMSYEELLALEEMIGDVNTGLSEGTVAKCLTEITHSSDQNQGEEEDKCTICLEEYKDRDGLAKLNCGHDYHVSCIKKWLLIKKVCPLCKASVVEE